ncbi:uncharacterized protein H6S33_004201 [Morchella sextelata]|jgi:L-lactate utilization protein LutB|uniref:uncharacterized protein n=1 Tax=Morchella sextelata TaxID=1174677 RepID=UPI001D03D144|nr:uncharacterized protein H6S33_004201 [Morchella sextelata]KAH0605744.1 hypothetical protein H6S33_004201 [Morchella sextelata]
MSDERLKYCNDRFDDLSKAISKFAENIEQNRRGLDFAVCESWQYWHQQAEQQKERFSKLQEYIGKTYDLLEDRGKYASYPILAARKTVVDEDYDKINESMKEFDQVCSEQCALDPEWPPYRARPQRQF